MRLGQAVVAEIQITRPLAGVERPPRRAHGAVHIGHRPVGGPPGHLLAGRVDHIEECAGGGVLQFAVDVLRVKHILVVGHYGCGGVSAAVDGKRRGLVDHWLHPIREVSQVHRHELEALPEGRARLDRLCELNVMRQVRNVASDVFVQDAWARGQDLHVHGWVYSLTNGLVKDLGVTIGSAEDIERLG